MITFSILFEKAQRGCIKTPIICWVQQRELPALFDSILSFLIDFPAKLLTRDDPAGMAAPARAAPSQSACRVSDLRAPALTPQAEQFLGTFIRKQ